MPESPTQTENTRGEIERSLRIVRANSLISPETRRSLIEIIQEALDLLDRNEMSVAEASQIALKVMEKVLSEMRPSVVGEDRKAVA